MSHGQLGSNLGSGFPADRELAFAERVQQAQLLLDGEHGQRKPGWREFIPATPM